MNRRDFFKGSVGLGGALLAGGVSASEIPDVDGEVSLQRGTHGG